MESDSDSDIEYSDFDENESDNNIEYSTIDEKEAAEETDSDDELQAAFSRGELKPGLVDARNGITQEKKEFTNNVEGLENKLAHFKLELPWIDRLDVMMEPAALAPELSVEIQEHAEKRQKVMKNTANSKNFDIDDDPLHNDFKREMTFYRQAQAAVLEGYQQLKKLKLATMRPGDYFAEMAKSDEQMQKIRNRLLKKQKGLEISDRVKKIREIKKYGKKVQIEVEQRKVKEKKEMISKLNKYRKGKIDHLDFLDGEGSTRNDSRTKSKLKKDLKKTKDKKVPFGKNRYTKRNSAADVDGVPSKKNRGSGNKFAPRSGKKKRNMRPGKMRRQTMKNRASKSRRK